MTDERETPEGYVRVTQEEVQECEAVANTMLGLLHKMVKGPFFALVVGAIVAGKVAGGLAEQEDDVTEEEKEHLRKTAHNIVDDFYKMAREGMRAMRENHEVAEKLGAAIEEALKKGGQNVSDADLSPNRTLN